MSAETKKCPYCFEEIKVEAVKCKWCRSNLGPAVTPHTWYRNMPDKRFLGVASMLALHTGLPVLAWRIIFVLLTLFHGVGLVSYFAVWALTPYKKDGRCPVERLIRAGKQAYNTVRKDENGNENAAV